MPVEASPTRPRDRSLLLSRVHGRRRRRRYPPRGLGCHLLHRYPLPPKKKGRAVRDLPTGRSQGPQPTKLRMNLSNARPTRVLRMGQLKSLRLSVELGQCPALGVGCGSPLRQSAPPALQRLVRPSGLEFGNSREPESARQLGDSDVRFGSTSSTCIPQLPACKGLGPRGP